MNHFFSRVPYHKTKQLLNNMLIIVLFCGFALVYAQNDINTPISEIILADGLILEVPEPSYELTGSTCDNTFLVMNEMADSTGFGCYYVSLTDANPDPFDFNDESNPNPNEFRDEPLYSNPVLAPMDARLSVLGFELIDSGTLPLGVFFPNTPLTGRPVVRQLWANEETEQLLMIHYGIGNPVFALMVTF